MAEPEDVIAEGALLATRAVRALWARRLATVAEAPRLTDLRRRLELFIAAAFPETPEIGVADPPAPPSLLERFARRHTSHLYSQTPFATTDGARIRLPEVLEMRTPEHVAARYRLLGLEQAARVARGTPTGVPAEDNLVRDLYLLAEAAAVDCLLVRMFPKLAGEIAAGRREAEESRPDIVRPSPRELAVESLARELLAAHPLHPPAPFSFTSTPAASSRWAENQRTALLQVAGQYRGIAPVPIWGTISRVPRSGPRVPRPGEEENVPTSGREGRLLRRPQVREASEDEDDAEPGTWMVRADDLQEKAEDPAGLQRPADRDQHADPGKLADALSELPEARLVRTRDPVFEVLTGEDPILRSPVPSVLPEGTGTVYPEWDWRAGAYRQRAAILRQTRCVSGNESWAADVLNRHGAMVRSVRRDFERLRPRRAALRRQPEGAELDVEALVAAHADRFCGGAVDDRFYIDTRPARRDAALMLVVDTSASTDGWVTGDRRIIDVEKEALLLVEEALAALGDPHAILAFSSAGPARVRVHAIKRFEEPAGTREIWGRIAGLEPDGFTRVGAVLRHATVGLLRMPVRHRVLLLLSDGRPNDVDQYEGRYGIEDTRMAVMEARLQSVHVFCLTVDREAPRYATRIFGRDFAVLSRAERLPLVLTSLLRGLVRG